MYYMKEFIIIFCIDGDDDGGGGGVGMILEK